MSLIQTSPPAIEPVTLAEAKLHLRVDITDDDFLIASLITAARQHIEQTLSLALITQTWSYFIDAWPNDPLALPLTPVTQLNLVRTFASDDAPTLIPTSQFQLDGAAHPPRLARRTTSASAGSRRPLNSIEIGFTAGFGATATDVPAPIRHALLLLVAHWYEHRDLADTAHSGSSMPDAISAGLASWRGLRLV